LAEHSTLADPGRGGVALIAFSTQSPRGARADAHLADIGRDLRGRGIPSRVFHVHFDPSNTDENARRVDRLLTRIREDGCRFAVSHEFWSVDVARRLSDSGLGLLELRARTIEESRQIAGQLLHQAVGECAVGSALNETAALIEPIGLPAGEALTQADLNVRQACGYKNRLRDNPFYRQIADTAAMSDYRGCAHCLNAIPAGVGSEEEVADRIVYQVRRDREVLPDLRTVWVAFAETFFDALGIAFQRTRGDALWHGLSFAMQCRPDVLAKRWPDLERVAGHAAACETELRVAVVGFENFSPREIDVLNRGAPPEDLEAAVGVMRRWEQQPPPGLRVQGWIPSFILFTPWTRPEDLQVNLDFIERQGLWDANIERLRVGQGTAVFELAQHEGLVVDGPVRTSAHPNGYFAEREIRFVDARVAATAAGFERLRPFAHGSQPELLAGVLATVLAAGDPAALDWDGIVGTWDEVQAATRAS
jgi:hypothetical protein